MPVIGFLSGGSQGSVAHLVAEFAQGLKESGYVEGQNVTIEYRYANGQYDRLPTLATELLGRGAGVLVSSGPQAALAARRQPRLCLSCSLSLLIRSQPGSS